MRISQILKALLLFSFLAGMYDGVLGQKTVLSDSLKHDVFKQVFLESVKVDYESASITADEAILYFENRDAQEYLSFWYEKAGDIAKTKFQFAHSLNYYTEGLQIDSKSSYKINNWVLLIGNLYFAKEDYYTANKFLTKIIETKDSSGLNKSLIAEAYLTKGIIFERQGKTDKAKHCFSKVAPIIIDLKDSQTKAKYYLTTGIFYLKQNQPKVALNIINKGLNFSKSTPNQPFFSNLLSQKASCYAYLGDTKKTISILDSAKSFAKKHYPIKLAGLYLLESKLYFDFISTDKAIEAGLKGIFHAESQKLMYEQYEFHDLLSKLYSDSGNFENAFFHAQEKNKYKTISLSENFKLYENKLQDIILKINNPEKEKTGNNFLFENHYIISITLLLLVILLVVRSYLKIKKTKHLLDGSLNSLTDESIEIKELNYKLRESNRKISGQAALANILKGASGHHFSSKKFLHDSLQEILSTSWFNEFQQGFIILTSKNSGTKIITSANIDKTAYHKLNQLVDKRFNFDLTDVSIQRRKAFNQALSFNKDTELTFVPLKSNNQPIGCLVLAVNNSIPATEKEVYSSFLDSVSISLSAVLTRKAFLEDKETQQKELEKFNQQLFAQNIILEERNIKIKKVTDKITVQKEKIEKAHKNITDSIEYAKYIQNALLPTNAQIDEIFENYFVLYIPKDVVSGDFYFTRKIKDYTVFAVGDCTGHGVAGALLTALSISILNDITKRPATYTPDYMLELLRAKIKNTFKLFGSKNNSGLDISLCILNTETNQLMYSGAFSPLILIRNGEITEYKSTRNPIGFYPVEKRFELNEITVEPGDNLYLFSDGYADQIGGKNKRKLKKHAFKEMLVEISSLEPEDQNRVLYETFYSRKGNNIQVDDVTVMGVQI